MEKRSPSNPLRPGRADRNASVHQVLDILRTNGPSTQAQIARETGLSRATVNNIVQSLRDQGVIEYQWKNRREALVVLASTRGSVIVVKVEERLVHACLFDFSSKSRSDLASESMEKWQDQPSSPAMVLDLVRRLIGEARNRGSDVAGLAVAIEGPLERTTGAIAPWAWQRLPEWRGLDIAQHFKRHLRLPLIVENDANLAALAEWSWGEGRGSEQFLHILCGSGIGGGMVLGGRIYRGGTGLAGEIGHMVIEEDGDLCFCGSRGCLTSFATERAILAAMRRSHHPRTTLLDVVNGAQQGDAACQRVVFEAGQHIGKAMATVVRVVAPSVVAIGGTLARAGDVLLDGLRAAPEVINLRAIGESARFCVATIVEDAPQIGGLAAILAHLDMGASTLAAWMLEPTEWEETSPAVTQ